MRLITPDRISPSLHLIKAPLFNTLIELPLSPTLHWSLHSAATISVNATLTSELLDCIGGNWGCALMTPYIASAAAGAAALAGAGDINFNFNFNNGGSGDAAITPSQYAGVLTWWGANGLPLVRRYT